METHAALTFNDQLLADVVKLWDLDFKCCHSEALIVGSPERSEFRTVIELEGGKLFLLEQIFVKTLQHKKYVARCLDKLETAGMPTIIPYRKNRFGDQILKAHGHYWQVQEFFQGIELDRPDYAFEEWRGKVLAAFLIDLHRHAHVIQEGRQGSFSLLRYIGRFMEDVNRCDPEYVSRIDPVYKFLEEHFFSVDDKLPKAFCHGDYHPLNIIWSPFGIGAVVDWEFCGYKPEMYDVANLIGCLGIEHPEALTADCVMALIEILKDHHIYDHKSWKYLFELILANRFGWMAEWLRKKDWEMVEMECDYWDILLNNHDVLKEIWQL